MLARYLSSMAIVLVLIPGGLEMVEDVGHLITLGHLEEGACADACDTSGCTPGSHACPCCPSLRVTVSTGELTVPELGVTRAVPPPPYLGSPREGFTRPQPRPPRA